MADRSPPSAARVATLTALPIALIAGLAAFWLLGGFPRGNGSASPTATPGATGPVSMPAAALDGNQAIGCRALVSQLPQSLRQLPRRPVTAGTEQNAAYGDPAITVACGVTAVSFAPTATVYPLGGVCWYADDTRTDATVWTTLDRDVPVQVTVPRSYSGAGQWVSEFSPAIARYLKSASTIPYGCRSS